MRLKDRERRGLEPGQRRDAGSREKQLVGGTAGETAEHGQGRGWSAVSQRAVAGRLGTLKSLTKAGLNDQKFPFNRTNKEITIYSISLGEGLAGWVFLFFHPPPPLKGKREGRGKRRIMCVCAYSSKEKNI